MHKPSVNVNKITYCTISRLYRSLTPPENDKTSKHTLSVLVLLFSQDEWLFTELKIYTKATQKNIFASGNPTDPIFLSNVTWTKHIFLCGLTCKYMTAYRFLLLLLYFQVNFFNINCNVNYKYACVKYYWYFKSNTTLRFIFFLSFQ